MIIKITNSVCFFNFVLAKNTTKKFHSLVIYLRVSARLVQWKVTLSEMARKCNMAVQCQLFIGEAITVVAFEFRISRVRAEASWPTCLELWPPSTSLAPYWCYLFHSLWNWVYWLVFFKYNNSHYILLNSIYLSKR